MSRFGMTLALPATLLAGVCLAQGPGSAPVRTARTATPPTVATQAQVAPRKQAAPATPTTAPRKTPPKKDRSGFQYHVMQSVRPAPPVAPTPDQLPATRPMVSFNNGKLSILANNSNLADVLNAVHAQTGAQFDTSGVTANDRVYVKLGPGAPKDVLAALLDGSRFNYAILGSPADPAAVAHVVLMPKSGGAAGGALAQQPQPGPRGVQQVPQQPQEETDEDMPQEEEQPVVEEQPQPEQQQQEQQQQPNGQNGVKTPEQLLQELQQMQQQQQQQQQQQNPNQQQPPQQQQQIPDHEIPD